MKPVVIGTPCDARGFALAGVPTYVCESNDDAQRALDTVIRDIADPLIVFSGSTFAHVADRCRRWRRDGRGPLFVVLPESDG